MPEHNESADAITKTAQGIIDYVASAPSHELPPVDVLAAYIRATTHYSDLVRLAESCAPYMNSRARGETENLLKKIKGE